MAQTWSPRDYASHASFVPALGRSLLERLGPQPGERILDLGCGDGTLTLELAARTGSVVGIDASLAMVEVARAAGVDARLMSATAMTFDGEFDAVFSNAVLHWIADAEAVLRGVNRALVPGGRFVAEFGGHANIAAIATAFRAVLTRHELPVPQLWFYPTADEYKALLESTGFDVQFITLFPRPTPLPTGLVGWLTTFRGGMLAGHSPELQAQLIAEMETLLAPSLRDSAGNWTADYVRLQVVAVKGRG